MINIFNCVIHSRKFRFYALTLPGALLVLVFLVIPLISIVIFSFWKTERYELFAEWNLENYSTILTAGIYLQFLLRSLIMALCVSIICLLYAYPVAYLIAKNGGRYRLILILLTATPFLTGIILRVTSIQHILGPIGLLNMGLMNFGIEPIQVLMYSHVATAIGLVYLWIPFILLSIYLSLLNFDFELLEVAKVCGARPFRAFFEITWPLNRIGTMIGFILVFIPSLAATVTPKFLGGVDGALYGNILDHQFGATGTWALGSAMGVVMFTVALIIILIIARTMNLKRSGFTGIGK